ncbi:RDD family protein [Streptomyces sp. NPDC051776]|uniref:RDD family protein n=1 Tax=Streptomyces sp. NPDC051776 TaxID=3155414 RepID=UPI003445A1AE
MIGVLALVACLAVGVLYEPVQLARYGQTLGKHACGLRVQQLVDGAPLMTGAAFGRWAISMFLGLLPFVGLVNVLRCTWDLPYRQCWHDTTVGSAVVTTRS